MPMLGTALLESLVPFARELLWNRPSMFGAAEAHTDQMPLYCIAVDEALATMENRKVVDKMHVSSLRLNFHLCGPGNSFDSV